MFVEFNKIKFKNILSYGNKFEELEFDKGMNLIRATNGSGKSSIIDAISFCLFGKPYRDIKLSQLINRYNEKDLVVQLEFTIQTDKYVITRGLKPNFFTLVKNGQEVDLLSSKKLNQDEINKIIGIDYNLFRNIVCVATTYNKPFLTLTAWEKRCLVESIFNIDILADMMKDVKKRNTLNKAQQKTNMASLAGLDENIRSTKNYLDELKISKANFEQNKLDEIAEQNEIIDVQAGEIQKHKQNIKTAKFKETELKERISDKSKIETELQELILNDKLADKRIADINNILKNLSEKSVCPLCHNELCNEHSTQYIADIEAERNSLIEKDYDTKIAELQESKNKMESFERLINTIALKIGSEEEKINSATNTISIAKTRIEKLLNEKFNVDFAPYEDKLVSLDERKKVVNDEITLLDNKIEIDDILTTVLGDDGVKLYFFRKLLPVLNQKVNAYLKKFEMPIHIEFNDSLEPNITSGRYETSYNQFSCGERSRIDVAILLSFFDISRSISNWSCSVLFMDEVIDGGVDASGIEQFIATLNNTVAEATGNKLGIYLISHKLAETAVSWTNEIEITKKGMFSKIVKK